MRLWRRLTIRTHKHAAVTVVTLTGIIDNATAASLSRRLNKLLDGGRDRVALDLHALTSCSIEGLDVLIKAGTRLHEHNRRLHVFVLHDRLHYLLTSTGRTDLFVLHPTLDEAITAAGTDQANNPGGETIS
ncbi:MAG: STAS domain-containing protein [Longispora sp.]|nr:STAS domain-containing protein [Longispora sp. (in: high G+C Gram-positive bacteria)]